MCSILFTPGTTGKSKGVMLSHKSLADNATCMDMGESEGTVSLTVLPIHHAYCFSGWLLAKELMVYAENGVIVFEMYPNADVVAAMQISDVEAVVKAKVAQINEDLPLYKRIIKVIIRDEELKKTASGKIKRKY